MRRHREGQTDNLGALFRTGWEDQFGSKTPPFGLTHATTTHFDPLLAGLRVANVRDEDPLLTTFLDAVDHDRITGA